MKNPRGWRAGRTVLPNERARIVAGIHASGAVAKAPTALLMGAGGVACHEFGEVLGVCAEVPLPRVAVRGQKLSLEGIGGVASMVKNWGLKSEVHHPIGKGYASSLGAKILKEEGIPGAALPTGLPQRAGYTRRVFAGGHQLSHSEIDESIPASATPAAERSFSSILLRLKSVGLLGILDEESAGLPEGFVKGLTTRARALKTPVFYESRSECLFPGGAFDIIKVNHSQIKMWFGSSPETDRDAEAAAEAVLARTGARSVIYTRGARGILVRQRFSSRRSESFIVSPEPRKLFDLVSAGDVVTAGLIFCVAEGRSLLQAACFAATAAELSLDNRHEKHIALQAILTHQPPL